MHELIHVADCGHRISLGRDWIGFANPIISEMRVRQTFREPFSWTEESHFAKLSKDFSAYGSRRLVESLPEYFAVRLVNRQTEIPDSPESRTLDRLLHPNENDLSFFRQYRLAENAENMNKTDKALTYYMAASKCDPSWFSVHVKLAGVLKGKREAIEELNKALDLMDQSGIPSSESTAVGVTVRKAQLHASLGDRVEADALMSKVVRNTLGDSSWRFYLSHINESLHQYGAAAADLYASRYFDRTIECSFGKFTNSANVFQRFKKSLKRGAGLGELYRRRAIFNVLEGDRADVEERRKYYEAAIHDYGKSMEHQGVGMTEGLFECAQICIRMKDQSQAAIFRDALRELDPISLPASVIALQLLEFGGDRQDCETRYRSLRELIEKKSEPEKRRPERSQWPGWLADNGSSEF
ncbi:MAG: hypothetical protein SGJ27_29015 [Candidatus Melainabacteria bacterium]|nr:hypothetical protein [Candidatus Melainabacteria bacterium]